MANERTSRPVRRPSAPVSAPVAAVVAETLVEASDELLVSGPQLPASWRDLSYDPKEHLTALGAKGDYLTVAERLVWFNRDQRALRLAGLATTSSSIMTSVDPLDGGGWQAMAYVRDVTGAEATMRASFKGQWSGGNIEKVETKALGRALGALGYGTANAPDLADDDDGTLEGACDSPVERVERVQRTQAAHSAVSTAQQSNPTEHSPSTGKTPPAPPQPRPAPDSDDEPHVTLGPSQDQWRAIEQLSRALRRDLPGRDMSAEQARMMIMALNRELKEVRIGASNGN